MDSENSSTSKFYGKRFCLLHDTKGFENSDLTGVETLIPAGSNCLFIRAFLNKNKTITALLLCPDGNQYYTRHQYNQMEQSDITRAKQSASLQLLILLNDFLRKTKKDGEDILLKSITVESRYEIIGAMKMIDTMGDILIQSAEANKIKDAYLRQIGESKK